MPLKRFDYEYKESADPGSEEVQLVTLWHGSAGIACHRDEHVLESWRNIHEELLKENEVTVEAKDLIEQYQALEEMAEPIKEALQVEIDRRMFDRGRCQVCP